MCRFKRRLQFTACAGSLFLCIVFGLCISGCGSTTDFISDQGTGSEDLNQEPDQGTLPFTVAGADDYSSFRVNATALDENQADWEFEVLSDSQDADGLRFVWNINNEAELRGNKQRYSFDRPGVHRIELTAYDSDHQVVFVRRVDIEVPGNAESPVAIAGDDQTVEENELAFLYGEESTSPDGHELSYSWIQTFGPPVLLLDSDQAIASFVTPALDDDAELEFKLTVSNGDLHGEDTVTVVVLNVVGISDSDSDLDVASTTGGSAQSSAGSGGGGGGGGGTAPCSLGDSDNDGLNDCSDECPSDPEKTATGLCGCGVEELDADANGTMDCIEQQASTYQALNANAGPDATIVAGGSATLQGSSNGGRLPHTYRWTPSTGLSNPNALRPVASPTSTTTYTLTVTDAIGRVDTDTARITVVPGLTANAGPDVTVPPGGSVTLPGTASGGTSPYTYSWSPQSGLSNPNIAQPVAAPNSTRTYTLTVTDSQSRTATDSVVVTVSSSNLVAAAGNDVTIPAGSTTTLNGSATGGTTPYTYRWTPTTGLNNPNIDRPAATPAATTTYTLTVTDSQARTATDSVVVSVQTSGAALSVSTTSLSFGSSTSSQTFAVWNSGSGTLSYTISDNAAWLTASPASGSSTGEQDSITVTVSRTGLADGLYQGQITVTPSSGALATVLVTMTVGTGGGSMNTALRTTGVAPLGVVFDAVGAASGVIQPPVVNGRADYSSFTYYWNFGDNPQVRWSTSNRLKNEAFGQVTAHVFETPGTYSVTLTVTESNGTPHAYQQQIVVQDPEVVYANSSNSTAERTIYVAAEGNDSNNGSFNSPLRTWGAARTRLFASNGPRRVLLRRGQTFAHTTTYTIENRQGPFTLGAYGTGANPVIQHSGTSGEVLTIQDTTTDVRVVDVDFTGAGVGYAIRPGVGTLLLRSRFTNFGNAISTSDLFGNRARNLIVDCQIVGSDRYGIYYNFGQHVAVMGTLIENVNEEHLLRCYLTHSVISNNIFRGGHTNKHQLKFCGYFPTGNPERSPGTATETVEHSIISDNRFESPGPMNWMVTIGPVDQGKDQRIENVLFERNYMRAGPNTVAMLYGNNRYVTVRNNVFDGTGGPAGGVSAVRVTQRGIEPAPIGYNVLNNTMYRSDSGDLVGVDISSVVQNTQVKNNLVSAPNSSVLTGGGQGLVSDHNVLTGNPMFTNPAGGDFSLRAGSPAIDAGVNLPSVLFDHVGIQRPFDGNAAGGPQWDAGAFEFRPTATGNVAPSVDAGAALQVTLPANSVNLDATVTDDGLPNPPNAVTVTWTKVNGVGSVTFGNANAVDTSATFSAAGTYTLRLTASDSALSSNDDVVVTVNAAAAVGTERMGINVAKVYGWGSQIPFVDAFKQSRPWISANADGTSSNTGVVVPVDALGYPLEIPYNNGIDPPQIVRTNMLDVDSGTYPSGTYTLMFQGNGTISMASNASGTFNQTGGEGTYTFTVTTPTSSGMQLRLTRSDRNDPVRNIRVIMPGHIGTYMTQPFYPPFVSKLTGFGVIRFMEWFRTNGNDRLVSWSDQVPTNYVTQAGPKGASFEYAIQLANTVGADPWLTIPHRADNGFVTEVARLARNNLSSQRKVYVEYSNELWNGMFDQTTYVRDQGMALGLGPDSTLAGRRYVAKRSAEIFKIFEDEFGVDRTRVVKVLAGQASQTTVITQLVDAFRQPSINGVPINPTNVDFSVLAIAPYFGNGLADSLVTSGQVNTITTAGILDLAELTYLPQAIARMQAHKVVADQYSKPLIAYEGGQHIVATGGNVSNTTLTTKLQAANRDPRMYDIYRTYFTAWFNTGGGVFAHYSFAQTPNEYGSWGAMEHLGQTNAEAHKYRALMDIVALPD